MKSFSLPLIEKNEIFIVTFDEIAYLFTWKLLIFPTCYIVLKVHSHLVLRTLVLSPLTPSQSFRT